MSSLTTDAYSDLFHDHPVPMVIFDRDFRLEEVNANAAKLVAMAGQVSLGTSAADFLAALSPATREAPDAHNGVKAAGESAKEHAQHSLKTRITAAMMMGSDPLPTAVLADGSVFAPRSHRLPSGRYQWTIDFQEVGRRDPKLDYDTLSLFQDASNALEEGFCLWDQDMRFVLCNQKYTDMIFGGNSEDVPKPGTHANDAIGLQFDNGLFDLPAGLTREQFVAELIAWVASYGEAKEFTYKNGRIIVVNCNKTKLGGYLLTALDITDIKEAERRSLETLRDASEALEEGFSLWDSEMCFQMCNTQYLKMALPYLEVPFEVGTPPEIALEAHARSDLVKIPDGMPVQQYIEEAMDWMRSYGGPREFHYQDGRTVIVRCNRTALSGYLLTAIDVTRERESEAELARQRDINHQNEKLSALGELLAGVAHELNNPLSIIVGYSQMLQGQLKDPKLEQRIDRINQAAERSARIIKTFLAMARQRPSKIEFCQIAEVVEIALDVAGYSLRSRGGNIEYDLPDGLPAVAVDKDQLAQVFSNLLINAEQATAALGSDAQVHVKVAHDRATAQVCVTVTDNGSGIAEDVKARIFEPFFTTKDAGEGTGFGLAFAHRIVTEHQGEIRVESQPDRGSRFEIRLPALAAAQAPPQTDHDRAFAGSGEHVLVVDDEEMVADLIAEMLSTHGYKVTKRNQPEAALALAGQQDFDAVLSDFKMPGMTGEQLLTKLVERHPRYLGRVGIVTGDSLSANVGQYLEDGSKPFIEKPVVLAELLKLVDQLCKAPEFAE